MKIDMFILLYMTKIALPKIKQPTRTSNPKKEHRKKRQVNVETKG